MLLEEREQAATGRVWEFLASLHVKFRPLTVSGLFSLKQLISLPQKVYRPESRVTDVQGHK
ncbi:MAG: hypothetical protein F9K13_06985 [Candidatus Methylomirabilis oxygeniifera]|uniref:Uncharacterized protein n=1 Tax=Methylomirabilis oxygeniifera TaxID=671143 RepID=D5MH61_METO1|nr:MAG: hypothetical protein F9K13_06985 [Candidatus Methylomirabilis oxyfera]CBE69092.1 protein of unknown function [Candidatus Methylomirabilis oxyfera]